MRSHSLTIGPRLRFLATLPLLFAVAGCSTEPGIPEFYEVTYSLTNDSLGSIEVLTYVDDVGVTVTVDDPPGGREVQYLISAGNPIGATANGTVQGGEIILEIRILGRTGEFARTDSCEDFTGQAVACSLEIPRETL